MNFSPMKCRPFTESDATRGERVSSKSPEKWAMTVKKNFSETRGRRKSSHVCLQAMQRQKKKLRSKLISFQHSSLTTDPLFSMEIGVWPEEIIVQEMVIMTKDDVWEKKSDSTMMCGGGVNSLSLTLDWSFDLLDPLLSLIIHHVSISYHISIALLLANSSPHVSRGGWLTDSWWTQQTAGVISGTNFVWHPCRQHRKILPSSLIFLGARAASCSIALQKQDSRDFKWN